MGARLRLTDAACAAAIAMLASGLCAPPAQASNMQAELFEKQFTGARADGVRAGGRVPALGVVELGYTRTQYETPGRSRTAAIEWRLPSALSPGLSLRATERRDGDLRRRTYEVGWTLRF